MVSFKVIISFIFVSFYYYSFSQEASTVMDRTTNSMDVIAVFNDRVVGKGENYYLNSDWELADIYFRSGLLVKEFPTRYDIQYNLLEVRIDDQIKVLALGKILKYEVVNFQSGETEVYSSCRVYRNENGTPLSGLCRVQERGKYALITNYYYSLKDPDYIKSLDVGNKEEKMFIMHDSYICINKYAYSLTAKKKTIISYFGEESDRVKDYVDKEKLNPKKKEDLLMLIEYLDSEN